MAKKPQFVENQIYHIYNRGVEKRNVFMKDVDYLRFIHDLFELNNEEPINNINDFFNKQSMEVQPRYIEVERKPRKLLVEILIFTLMPNHFHLLLKQKRDKGIIRFMQKLGTGYTMYFNKKYERVGSLFQGRFKAVHIKQEAHFLHIPYYIHTNPLDLIYGGSTSIDYLENYRWSSFPDYVGKKNFPSVTSREWLLGFFGGPEELKKMTKEWLGKKNENIKLIKEATIDD